jgi:hypothetical protein
LNIEHLWIILAHLGHLSNFVNLGDYSTLGALLFLALFGHLPNIVVWVNIQHLGNYIFGTSWALAKYCSLGEYSTLGALFFWHFLGTRQIQSLGK